MLHTDPERDRIHAAAVDGTSPPRPSTRFPARTPR
jgi:hypothetical protein